MHNYTPINNSILTSTIWLEAPQVKVLWLTLLLAADQEGKVAGSVPGIARLAVISVAECRDALRVLKEPDPDSRTKDFDGRRLVDIDGGWRILNYQKHRDLINKSAQKNRERQRRKRERDKALRNVAIRYSNDQNENENENENERSNPPYPPLGEQAAAAAVDRQSDPKPCPQRPQNPLRAALGTLPATQGLPDPKPPLESNLARLPTRTERVRTEWSGMPIQELARRCKENPHDAAMSGPENRTEVLHVQRAWCEAVGLPIRELGSLSDKNHALTSILTALATHSLADVLRACAQAKTDDWAQGRVANRDGTPGKKCRLEWMSLNVIRRLLDAADTARPSVLHPKIAAILEAESKRELERRA